GGRGGRRVDRRWPARARLGRVGEGRGHCASGQRGQGRQGGQGQEGKEGQGQIGRGHHGGGPRRGGAAQEDREGGLDEEARGREGAGQAMGRVRGPVERVRAASAQRGVGEEAHHRLREAGAEPGGGGGRDETHGG